MTPPSPLSPSFFETGPDASFDEKDAHPSTTPNRRGSAKKSWDRNR
jgi:hypothetical protein